MKFHRNSLLSDSKSSIGSHSETRWRLLRISVVFYEARVADLASLSRQFIYVSTLRAYIRKYSL